MRRAVRRILLSFAVWVCLLAPNVSLADPRCPPPREKESSVATDECGQPTLSPGDFIRFKTASSRGFRKGHIESVDDVQLTVVDEDGAKTSLSWLHIDRLDLQVGLRREYGKGILIGAGLGLVLGLILPSPEFDFCVKESCDARIWERRQMVHIGVGVGILSGLIAAASLEPTGPKWERIRLPYRRLATSLEFRGSPRRDGVAVRITFSF
jgi:hypothetical protein